MRSYLLSFLLISCVMIPVAAAAEEVSPPAEAVYDLEIKAPGGEGITVSVVDNPEATDLEGRLAEKYRFYTLKFPYRGNYLGLNLPEGAYFSSGGEELRSLVFEILAVYDGIYSRSRAVFGAQADGFRQNITFGRTDKGHPFATVYPSDKTVNIFMDSVPYSEKGIPLSDKDVDALRHELGHSVMAVAVGNFIHPKFRAIEEGFVNYLAYGDGSAPRTRRIVIEKEKAGAMSGLAQMDIDVSIWGEEVLDLSAAPDGYKGITHHFSGEQFVREFISFFGEKRLPEFLKRLKAKDAAPLAGDYGSSQIREVLERMGYSREEVDRFEKAFHERLLENVFIVS